MEQEFQIEKVTNIRFGNYGIEFLVRWGKTPRETLQLVDNLHLIDYKIRKGQVEWKETWESASNMTNGTDSIGEFFLNTPPHLIKKIDKSKLSTEYRQACNDVISLTEKFKILKKKLSAKDNQNIDLRASLRAAYQKEENLQRQLKLLRQWIASESKGKRNSDEVSELGEDEHATEPDSLVSCISDSFVAAAEKGRSDRINHDFFITGIKDPSAWIVKCRPGEEKIACLQLMRKSIACANKNKPLQIKSVVVPEVIEGCVYIEASRLTHVMDAISGIPSILTSWSPQEVVQMSDMARRNKKQTGITLKLFNACDPDEDSISLPQGHEELQEDGPQEEPEEKSSDSNESPASDVDQIARKLEKIREQNRIRARRAREKRKQCQPPQIYSCDQCKIICSTASVLKRHVNSHTAIYRCNYCDQAFNRLDARNRHERNHELKSSKYIVKPEIECAYIDALLQD